MASIYECRCTIPNIGDVKKFGGVADQRSLPKVYSVDFDKELLRPRVNPNTTKPK